MLPLSLPAAAPARAGAELRRGRRARRAPRRDRLAPVHGGAQARARSGPAADRAPAALRRALGGVFRDEGPARPGLPRLRREPDHHGVHRLRRVLRRSRALSRVRIPPTLRTETDGARELEASGRTVRELLDDLMGRFPTLRAQLLDDEELVPFVNVYVEGEDVRTKDGLETPVDAETTVILLPAMAGGCARLFGARPRRQPPSRRAAAALAQAVRSPLREARGPEPD